jgi:hypothetical protein
MHNEARHDDLAHLRTELATLHAAHAATTARLATLERRRGRGRAGRAYAVALVALAIALIPFGLLAANPFNDLNPDSVHNANIDAIYNAGITKGCVPNESYCPNGLVTREEMASFLARTAGLGSNPPVANAANSEKLGGLAASGYLHKNQAFTIRASASNIGAGAANNQVIIDNSVTNDKPSAKLFVTMDYNPGGTGPSANNPHPIGVYYQDGKWRIYNVDGVAMPVNAAFNVLVVYIP